MKRIHKLYIIRVLYIAVDLLYLFGWFGFIFFSKEAVAKAGYIKPQMSPKFIIGSVLFVAITIFGEWQIRKEKSRKTMEKK